MDNSKVSFSRGGFCFTFSQCFDPSGAVLPFLMLTTTKNNDVIENVKIPCGHASGMAIKINKKSLAADDGAVAGSV